MQNTVHIFCSSAQKDRSFLSDLRAYLFPLQHLNFTTAWSDTDISPGINQDEAITTQLDHADVILLLISSAFLSSDSCYKQMQRAMERYERGEVRVVPIILRLVDLQNSPIGELASLPRNGKAVDQWKNRSEALYDVSQGIQQVVREISSKAISLASREKKDARETYAPRSRHNLLRLSSEFFGRERDITRVLLALASRSFIICIEGMGGVGKTTLAIQTALYSLSDPNRLFERVVWITAKDKLDQERWFNEVLDIIARELGSPILIKLPQEQKALEVEALLSEKSVLIIIDNYETIKDDDLDIWIERKIPEPSKVLITSRASNWRNAEAIQLRGMQDAEALTLIRNHCRRWGLESLEMAADDKLLPLVQVTEGNPGAIELALGLVKRGGLSFEEVINHLYHGNDSVTHIFNIIYERSWEKMHIDAKHILMVIPFFTDAIKREALGAATGLSGFLLQQAVEEVVQFMFLEVNQKESDASPQYSTHPLTRAFSNKQLKTAPEYEQEARQRWYEYYYNIISFELMKGRSGDRYWDSLVRSGEASRVNEEWSGIRKVLEWADLENCDAILIDLMLVLAHYMNRQFYYDERFFYTRRAVDAAERISRLKEAALFKIDTLGWTLIETNRLSEAEQVIERGLQIAQSIEPLTSEVLELITLAHIFLARVALQQGKMTVAEQFIHKIDEPSRGIHHCRPVIKFRAAMIAGDITYRQGDIAKAIQLYEQAQQIGGQYGSEGEDEDLAYRMAIAYLASGDLERAEHSFNNLPKLANTLPVTTGAVYAKLEEAHFAKARKDTEQARHLILIALNYLSPTIDSHWMLDEIHTFLKNLETP